MGCGHYIVVKWCIEPVKDVSEPREEKLNSPVHGGRDLVLASRGAVEEVSEPHRGAAIEEPVVAEIPDPPSSRPESRRGSPTHGEAADNMGENAIQRHRGRVIITPWGERYHLTPECPTLSATRRIKFSPWCQACASTGLSSGLVISMGPGKVAHLRGDCPRRDRLAVGYQVCQICVQRGTAWAG